MPELPEVESARTVIEKAALRRTIADVDDSDTYECRPHHPGEIREALVGRQLTAARRQGKTMWCETSGPDGSDGSGPRLGIHLGMSGRILVAPPVDADGDSSRREVREGGDYVGSRPRRGRRPPKEVWFRFTLDFEDGGSMRLLDTRRLGRVRLEPDLDALGPDAAEISRAEFRTRIGKGTAPVKARLLDQHAIAGIGNLLADEVLWQAAISPRRPSGELTTDELDGLRRQLRASIRSAIRHGGVHTGEIVRHRRRGEHCPRCGAEMTRATVGSRTTWWCPQEQH